MEIDIKGLAQNRKELEGMIRRLKEPQKVLKIIGEDAVTFAKDSFRGEIDPAGKPWKALSPAREKWKLDRNKTKILVDNSILRNSINAAVKGRSVFLSMIDYGMPHQFGPKAGEKADGGAKKRAFLPFEKVGEKIEVMSTGRAAKFAARVAKRIVDYVLGGKSRQRNERGGNTSE